MKKLMKSAALVVVGLTFGGAVAAGAVDVPGLDTGNGITLCADNKGGVIRPSGSTCPARTTAFTVASQAQVDQIEAAHNAVEDRIATLETSNAALAERVTNLEPAGSLVITSQPNSGSPGSLYEISVTGDWLQPGADIFFYYSLSGGPQGSLFGLPVGDDGTFTYSADSLNCASTTNVYFTSTDHRGDPVQSNTITKGAGCF